MLLSALSRLAEPYVISYAIHAVTL